MIWLRAFTLVLSLHAPLLAMAASFEDGVIAYDDGDYDKAREIWEKLADRDNAASITNLANLYNKGLGVEKDTDYAFSLYKRAAERNYPQAEFALGFLFEARKDYKNANYWYEKAALQELAIAQNYLGDNYKKGLGVEKNLEKAIYWYKRATSQGFTPAQVNLGLQYSQGKYKDLKKAKQWLILGASSGVLVAQLRLAEIYEASGNIAEATKWYWIVAEQDNPIAQTKLGLIFLNGKGSVRRSYFKAISFLGVAAKKGNLIAQTELGVIFLQGIVVERDIKEGLRLLNAAADKNHVPAFFQLGRFYSENTNNKDYAKKWLNKAVVANYEEANLYLGEFLESQGDLPAAIKSYEAAANKGSQKAIIKLGNIYLGGRKNIEKNPAKAREYLLLVANQGNRVAQYNLGVSWIFESKPQNQNLVEAVKWLLLSASQNLKPAKDLLKNISGNLSLSQIDMAQSAAEKFQANRRQEIIKTN